MITSLANKKLCADGLASGDATYAVLEAKKYFDAIALAVVSVAIANVVNLVLNSQFQTRLTQGSSVSVLAKDSAARLGDRHL